jgi:eukaryotic-like serine/threonine-protein kinase
MSLAPGSRLGPYVTVAAIGAGGMGEVYRARDTRLEREVAVKLLAGDLHSNEELRERLAREARAVARLSHPNICALYDVGREGERDYLVMELLNGRTLDDRLRSGPLPIDQILQFGMQIASALAAAHAAGIVHRDLKPANVMLTASGVKLLDFGIAKAFATQGPAGAPAEPGLTHTGLVVGTVPYMAPEQIEGKPADPRTDVFALGAVLYEMATGRPAFSAPTQAALVATVLTTDPPSIASVRPGMPAALDQLIRACLAKDPAQRWQSARDVELFLRSVSEDDRFRVGAAPGLGGRTGAPANRPALSTVAAWGIAALAVIAAVWFNVRPGRGDGLSPSSYQFSIAPPDGGGFAYFGETDFLSASPDGSHIAFVARDSAGQRQVWLRPLSAGLTRLLAGTQGAQSVFWSPDGRSLGFFTPTKLARIDLPDGAPVTLTAITSSTGQFGTWGRHGDILFAGIQGDAIYRVPAAGGTPSIALGRDSAHGERFVQWPMYLPDGEHFLYVSRPQSGSDQLMESAPGRPPIAIMPIESLAQYSDSGFIAFVRDGTLLGQAFDWKKGRVSGEPFAVTDGVRYFLSTGGAAFAASVTGLLVFQTGRDVQRLTWFDRQGHEIGTAGSPASYLTFSISPDGRRLLTDRENPETGTWDVWMVDLERGTENPLANTRFTEAFGRWLPDSRSVVYSVAAGTAPNLRRRDLASGAETPVLPVGPFQQPVDVSPDGRTLLYTQRASGGTFDLWTLSLAGEGPPAPFLATQFDVEEAAFSPDGRFIALISNETGRPELYVTPFPGPGEKVRVSTEGARAARWTRGSHELIYLSIDWRVIAVPVRTEPTIGFGTQTTLFAVNPGASWRGFDVTADGQRFLASIPIVIADKRPITVITDWTRNRR